MHAENADVTGFRGPRRSPPQRRSPPRVRYCVVAAVVATLAAGGAAATTQQDQLLPYPRSVLPTGQAGVIYVMSEHNITAKADQVCRGRGGVVRGACDVGRRT